MNDADRIIAAHADQARRTRRLLVWLLVGVPLAVGLVVGILYFAVLHPGSSGIGPRVTPTTSACVYVDGHPDLYDSYCQTPAP